MTSTASRCVTAPSHLVTNRSPGVPASVARDVLRDIPSKRARSFTSGARLQLQSAAEGHLPPTEKVVFDLLVRRMNDGFEAVVAIGDLAEACVVDPKTARRTLQPLERKGIITSIARTTSTGERLANGYRLTEAARLNANAMQANPVHSCSRNVAAASGAPVASAAEAFGEALPEGYREAFGGASAKQVASVCFAVASTCNGGHA